MSRKSWHRKKPTPECRKPKLGRLPGREFVTPDKGRVAALMRQVEDAERTSNAALARALGCGELAVKALKEGRALPRELLDAMERNAFHREDGTMRVRMLSLLRMRKRETTRIIGKIQDIAAIVQEYREALPATHDVRQMYTFQPKLLVRVMSLAIEQSYWTLARLHDECPEFDQLVFAKAPSLLAEIEELPKGIWKAKLRYYSDLSGF